MKRMAIICSTDYETWPMGGMLSFLQDIIPYLGQHYRIELWGVRLKGGNCAKYILIGNGQYPIHYFSYVNASRRKIVPNIIRVIFDIITHRAIILKKRYDVLYFHGIPLVMPFLKLSAMNPPLVTHLHGITNPFSNEKGIMGSIAIKHFYEKIRYFAITRSHIAFLAGDSQSYATFLHLFKNQNTRLARIHNFADKNLFYKRNKEAMGKKYGINPINSVVIYNGRFVQQKDPILAIKVVMELSKTNDNILLVMVGDGPLLTACKDIANENLFSRKIIFMGKRGRDEIAELLSLSDVYLYTSFGNGVPISVVEALMCGVPIVTPDIAGIHDIVINNETGYIVQGRNPAEFALAIKKILGKNEKFEEMCLLKSVEFTPAKAAIKIANNINTLWD